MNRWYGYLHVNGRVFAKRFCMDWELSEARESDFVRSVTSAFHAKDYECAISTATRMLGVRELFP